MGFSAFNLKNGQACETSRIPVLEEGTFQAGIKETCRSGARLVNLFGLLEGNGDVRILAFLGHDDEGRLSLSSMRLGKDKSSFGSLTPDFLAAHLFEREIAEQFAVRPLGHPWLKPVRYHKSYGNAPGLWPEVSSLPIPGRTRFFEVGGEEVHEVAVGPVHAGVIEPGHFRFQCHGEEVLSLEIQLGYQHRGIERWMEQASPLRAALLAESIAGDSVIGHAMAYCETMESLSNCRLSARAQALRCVALELERLSNHAGDLGALGMDIGFLPSAAYFGRLRGEFLNLLMEFTGNRYGRSFCRPGGVLFDIDEKMAADFGKRLLKAKKELGQLSDLFFGRPSVLARLEGVGVVSNEAAKQWGLAGPAARASGRSCDVRTDHAHSFYRFYHVPLSSVEGGDVYARSLIRWLESQRSLDFLMDVLRQLPAGELFAEPPPPTPGRLAVSMVEGWRGEIMHVAVTDSHSRIARYKIKDPSFHNWAGLSAAVRGAQISDFPLCNKSFNLSYAGHDL